MSDGKRLTSAEIADRDMDVKRLRMQRRASIHHDGWEYLDCVPASDYDALAAENDKLRGALAVLNQALLEVRHAQNCGAEWYTKGDNGLYMQVRMWVDKGFKAIADTRHTVQPK